MRKLRKFLLVLAVTCFIGEILGEIVHEVLGHGLLVIVLGGSIRSIYVSVLWPYESSYIEFYFPRGFPESWKAVLVYSGGIVACLLTSFLIQVILLLKKIRENLSLLLFWTSYWTLISSSGYLLLSWSRPFGDVKELIELGVLSGTSSAILGFAFFAVGYIGLTESFKRVLHYAGLGKWTHIFLPAIWLLLPATVYIYSLKHDVLSLTYLPVSAIPSLLSRLFVARGNNVPT